MQKLFLALFLMISFCFSAEARLQESATLSEYFDRVPLQEGDLIVCDVDMTLLIPKERAFLDSQIAQYWSVLPQLTEWTPLLKEVVGHLLIRYDMQLIEPALPELIAKIQLQGIPVIALTACQSYPYEGKESSQYRYEQLAGMGVHFSNPLQADATLHFEELDPVFGYYPSYYRGMIVSNPKFFEPKNRNEKGVVLASFLSRLPQRPKRVVFLDDKESFHRSVEKALKELGIEYEGCLYTGGDALSQEALSVEQFSSAWLELIQEAKRVIASTPDLSRYAESADLRSDALVSP